MSSRQLYDQLIRYPAEVIPILDSTVTEIFIELFPEVNIYEQLIQVRPFNVGRTVSLRELDPSGSCFIIAIEFF